ncbi:hypothetical protein AX15_005516 [Amanita polypyramis BW_CC]|nr:hypothetical protein AX15_005516 [Amanita polypyramis BW_CC]
MPRGFLGRLVVALVLSLISFIAYSSQIFVIWPWYGSVWSVDLVKLLLPFNILVAMLLWNYYLCVAIDPGRVPNNWKPDTHADGYEVKRLSGKPRYCRMCERYKPPRAHHCRTCDRCVLRMDHHCPWINNCVGHFNYGYFIRFLFYVDIACLYHIAMVSKRLYSAIAPHSWDIPSDIQMIFIVLNYVACVPVLLLVGGFSLYHFYLLSGNSTTIEGWEKDKVATMIRRGKIQEIKFPYDLGVRRNIGSVLGTKPWMWCWPTRTSGTGLKFEIAEGDDVEHSWPPEDPDRGSVYQKLDLRDSPWTYENGSVNPQLQPSNSEIRQSTVKRRRHEQPGVLAVPPYHPDYHADSAVSVDDYNSPSTSEDELPRARRGSEGFEVRPVNREEILRRYLEEMGEEPDKYVRYIPEPDIDSDNEDEMLIAHYPDSIPDTASN